VLAAGGLHLEDAGDLGDRVGIVRRLERPVSRLVSPID
jgi:hypothetical protein